METGKLKIFATEARVKLMQGVKRRLQALGFDLATGEAKEMPQRLEGGAVLMGTSSARRSTNSGCRFIATCRLVAFVRWLKKLRTHGSTA